MKSITKLFAVMLIAVMMLTSFAGCVSGLQLNRNILDITPNVSESKDEDKSTIDVDKGTSGATTNVARAQENLFLHAKATANADNFPASNAVDGNLDPNARWAAYGGPLEALIAKNKAPAITITMLEAKEILSIEIGETYFSDDGSKQRYVSFKVVAIDGDKETVVTTSTNLTSTNSNGMRTHIVKFPKAVKSKSFRIELSLSDFGKGAGVNITEIFGFAPPPIVLYDPQAPKGTTDFAIDSVAKPSSELNSTYSIKQAMRPFSNYNSDSRWGAPTVREDVTAELTFKQPVMLSFVKVAQYHGPKPSGWGDGQRIASIKVELADDGEPYTVVVRGAPHALDDAGLDFIQSGLTKTLEMPMRAVRMRVTITPNHNGPSGLNIKSIEAYGISATPTEGRNAELQNVLNVAYSKSRADYTPTSYAAFESALVVAKAIYGAGTSATLAQTSLAINKLTDAIYALEKTAKITQRIKVAFVGDSITYGHSFDGSVTQSFPALVYEKLGAIAYEIKNFAISGRTLSYGTADKPTDLPYMKETNYTNSLMFKPDVVVIMLGTNDSKPMYNLAEQTYASDARKLINSYKLLDSQPVIFFNTSPKVLTPLGEGKDIITLESVTKVVGWQKNILKAIPGLYSIDMFAKSADFTAADFNVNDGVHPGQQGHKKMSDFVIEAFDNTKPILIRSNRQHLQSLKDLASGGFKPEIWEQFDTARKALESQINSATSTAQDIVLARTALDVAYEQLAQNIDNSKIRVACVGDSITKGDGAGANRYPEYLQIQLNKLESNRFIVRNFGENGMMASDRQNCGLTDPTTATGAYPYYQMYTGSIGFMPNVVTIKLGTNDAKYEGENKNLYKDDMKKIIAVYQGLPSRPQIILITSARAVVTPGQLTEGWANAINNTFVPLQRQLATELGLPLIDINKYTQHAYANGSAAPSDGIHGNYPVIAEGVWKALMGDGELSDGTNYVSGNPKVAFNKKYLNAIVEKGKDLLEADYDAGSWQIYLSKRQAAIDIINDSTATIQEVDTARTELVTAMNTLTEGPKVNIAAASNGTTAVVGVDSGFGGSKAANLIDGNMSSYWLGWHDATTSKWAAVGNKNYLEFTFAKAEDVGSINLYTDTWSHGTGSESMEVYYYVGNTMTKVAKIDTSSSVDEDLKGFVASASTGITKYTLSFAKVNTLKIRILLNPNGGGQREGIWTHEVEIFNR